MESNTSIEKFIEYLKHFFCAVPSLRGYAHAALIVNPSAGVFRNRKAFSQVLENLKQESGSPESQAGADADAECSIFITSSVEDGAAAAKEICRLAVEKEGKTFVMTAGGDGTANTLCTYLLAQTALVRDKIILFRLPMGTGNDGLDASNMDEAWKVLHSARKTAELGAVRIKLVDGKIFYAFNIASIGLDAWVTDLTNRIKKVIPGSFYSIMVDVATLFYEKCVKVDTMKIELKNGTEQVTLEEKLLLLAMGVSGHRTYGNNKLVLPGDENICAIRPMKFFKKFKLKNNFYVGRHVDFEETLMRKAGVMTITCGNPVPMQYDGEALWLAPGDFPLEMSVVPTGIHVLTAGGGL